MTFKTNLPVAGHRALGGFSILQVAGPDASAFLQSQTMNDVAALADGQWQWNGLLTPKGRVVALFALLRITHEHFAVVLPDMPADELREQMQRFVFRSRLRLLADAALVAATGPGAVTDTPATAFGTPESGLALDLGADGGPRWLWLLPAGHEALSAADPATDQAWRAADLAHGLPRLGAGQREAWTPQMLSLERLGAYSLKKGCYPGQEIVARTHFLGKSKRGLVRLEAEAPLFEGGAVRDAAGRELGSVVSVANLHDGALGLAVLPSDLPMDALLCSGASLTRRPLLAGLAR